jgi:hypothetical protein
MAKIGKPYNNYMTIQNFSKNWIATNVFYIQDFVSFMEDRLYYNIFIKLNIKSIIIDIQYFIVKNLSR